jgi:hypothetical protein
VIGEELTPPLRRVEFAADEIAGDLQVGDRGGGPGQESQRRGAALDAFSHSLDPLSYEDYMIRLRVRMNR